jgi:hypothetical protein
MNQRTFGNDAEIAAWLIDGVTSFDLNSPAGPGGKPLADALVDNHVAMISARSLEEQRGPDGSWPANQEPYATIKREEFGSTQVNVRTGEMLSTESLEGQHYVQADTLVHVYGTGRPGEPAEPRPRPTKRGKPRKPRAVRAEPTDIQKAQWAEEAGRGFFGLDDQIKDRNAEIVSDALAEHLRGR